MRTVRTLRSVWPVRTGLARPGPPGGPRVYYGWWMVGGLSITERHPGARWSTRSRFSACPCTPGWGSSAQLNGGYTAGVAVSGVVAIPAGRWLQRHGARGLMTTGSLLTVAALAGWSQVRALPEFYACFIVAGLAMAATLYEPAFAVTAAWFTRHRASAVLALTIAGGLASTVFVPLAGALIAARGWRGALLVLAGIMAVITLPIHALLLRRGPSDLGLHPDGEISGPDAAQRTPPSDRAWCREPATGKAAIIRRASFRWIVVSLMADTAGKLAVTVTLVAYLAGRGYSLSHATLAAGAVGLLQVAGRLATTWLRRRIPEHRTAIVLFTAQGLALPIPLLTSGHGPVATILVALLVMLFGLGYGMPDLLRGTLVADYYGPQHYARINGVLSAFAAAALPGRCWPGSPPPPCTPTPPSSPVPPLSRSPAPSPCTARTTRTPPRTLTSRASPIGEPPGIW
jgi:MFS family permease